jgi:hypothetical protein
MVPLSDPICCRSWLTCPGPHPCATNGNLGFPLLKGVLPFIQTKDAEVGLQSRLPVPVLASTNALSVLIPGLTVKPCHLRSFSRCCNLKTVSDRQAFSLSALMQDPNGYSRLWSLQLRSPLTANMPLFAISQGNICCVFCYHSTSAAVLTR